jgi:hypothetical protein
VHSLDLLLLSLAKPRNRVPLNSRLPALHPKRSLALHNNHHRRRPLVNQERHNNDRR